MAVALGVDESKLRNLMSLHLNSGNINEFGRYDDLKKTVDKTRAKEYFEKIEGIKIIPPKVGVKVDNLLREFILEGGFEIDMPREYKDSNKAIYNIEHSISVAAENLEQYLSD